MPILYEQFYLLFRPQFYNYCSTHQSPLKGKIDTHNHTPVFDGEEYDLWAARMTTHLKALDLWELIEEDYAVWPLPENPTVAQLKNHKERKTTN